MGKQTGIAWTDHTANYWSGCTKVSAGCKNCYADTLSRRFGKTIWGPTAPRQAAKAIWSDIYKWDEAAREAGVKRMVFTSSMCDFFEGAETCQDPESYAMICAARRRVFEEVIPNTPNLIHQLLTKRPENIMEMVPDSWRGCFPANVWVGTSVEDHDAAEKRIPHLLEVPARVRFLSCEPLLGAVDLTKVVLLRATDEQRQRGAPDVSINSLKGRYTQHSDKRQGVHWVLVGGESGGGARPMHPDWARSLRDQCAQSGVPYFFKQHGEYLHESQMPQEQRDGMSCGGWANNHRWSDDSLSFRIGKAAAGHLLDGVEWHQFPKGE